MAKNLDSFPVAQWLKELRMECYRRNLDDYPTVHSLLEMKESDLKKLGIINVNDRSVIMDSLADLRVSHRQDFLPQNGKITSPVDSKSKGTLSKSGIKKLKGLLGSVQKKTKKTKEAVISKAVSVDIEEGRASGLPSIPEKSRNEPTLRQEDRALSVSMDNGLQSSNSHQLRVENDYVPDPQNSPQFQHQPLQRAYTICEVDTRPATRESGREWNFTDCTGSPSPPMPKHNSIVSMESGLSLTCEEEFNATLPLDQQPWFHGAISQADSESLLEEDGDFLVHENILSEGQNVLSMMWEDRFLHINIGSAEVVIRSGNRVTTNTKYQFDNGAFDSIPELIFNHLRYQIPVSREQNAIILNPVCKIGRGVSLLSFTSGSTLRYSTYSNNSTTIHRTGHSTPSMHADRMSRDLRSPEYFLSGRPLSVASSRATRSASFSPHSSCRSSPSREIKAANQKSGTPPPPLPIIDLEDEDEQSNMIMGSIYRDAAPSPDLNTQYHDIQQPKTPSQLARHQSSASNGSEKITIEEVAGEGDDYELMESVSIRPSLPNSPTLAPKEIHSPPYAMHSLMQKKQQSSPSFMLGTHGMKYAEVSFNRSRSSTQVTTPYASHTEIFKMRSESVNSASTRVDTSPRTSAHPLSSHSHYVQLTPSNSSIYKTPPKSKKNPITYASIDAMCFSSKASSQSSSPSHYASRPVSMIGKSVSKAPQTIHEISSFLKDIDVEELAIHLTKADSVSFLLSPRPGEDEELWENRVQEVSACSGAFIGLQILAMPEGEKLWRKLYYRHLSLSMMVAVAIISAGDTVDRAKLLKLFIELANLLQSGSLGNLFSFMAIMTGLASPQVTDLKHTWAMLKNHYSDISEIYHNQLTGMISALNEGASVYAVDKLTVPAIQHLKGLFNLEGEGTQPNSSDLHQVLEDFSMNAKGLGGVHNIISSTADLHHNAKQHLSNHSYDTVLFDFFMQDIVRMHLQQMGSQSDHPLERYRRFTIVLDAMVSKINSP